MIGIFVAGGAAGGFVALRLARHQGPMDRFVIRQLDRMTKDLELTSEQREQVEKILRDGTEELATIRRDAIGKSGAKIREMNQKISAVLTPEQQTKFEELLKKQRERIRHFQQERGDRRGPPEGPQERPGEQPPPPPPGSNP